jgi:hypothetical protein
MVTCALCTNVYKYSATLDMFKSIREAFNSETTFWNAKNSDKIIGTVLRLQIIQIIHSSHLTPSHSLL